MKICLYLTNDLMFTSRVKPFAAEQGYEVQFPGFQEIDQTCQPDLVIFDLEFVGPEDLQDVMMKLRDLEPQPVTVAYAPHVKEAKLTAAREAGVSQVWTRGQFNKNFEKLFA